MAVECSKQIMQPHDRKAAGKGHPGLGAPGAHGVCAGKGPTLKDRPGLLGVLPAARAVVGAGKEVPGLLAHLLHQPPQALLAICRPATAPASASAGAEEAASSA